jgi:hypothetical protein
MLKNSSKICIIIFFLILIGMLSRASALTITPTTGILNETRWQGNETANLSVSAIQTIVGSVGLELLYKQDVDSIVEEGIFANSYNTSFYNQPFDPQEAIITWVGGTEHINGSPIYLYVKDGNQIPAWYIYNLSALSWDGMDTLYLSNFWPNQGAISHVTIVGVPEPKTLLLLGAGLIGLGVFGRKFKKNSLKGIGYC